MFRRSFGVLVVLVLSAAVGCTTTAPFISNLAGLPPSVVIPGTVVLTASGGPGSSRGLFTWTFSTDCGGTFTSTTTPNNGPANPITIGPTDAETVQVTYDSTGATPGVCTFTVKLVTSSGRSATLQVTTTIAARLLTVTKTGTGSGTVTSNPAGINCGATCVAGFNDGTVVTLTATPDAGSKFDGWSGDPDCSDGQVTMDADKTCTATFTLITAGLSLTKGDSPDPVTYGNNVTYTLTVTNNGPDPATNVTLTDTLPTNVMFVSATPSQGSCSGTTTVTCTLGTINNGANATVTIVVQAKAAGIDLIVDDDAGSCAYTGSVSDMASVTATEPDPVPGDNTATADTAISANYNTIGAAITAASGGHKIFVCPGTYNESLIITKALTITGAGIAAVTINPTTTGYGIEVSGGGSNVTLEQFTLNAGNSRNFMIHVSHVSNFTIQNAKLVGAGKTALPGGQPLGGVDLNTVTTALVKSVEVQDVSRNGIALTNSTGVTIDSANVHDTGVSAGWAGIAVYASSGTTSVAFAGSSTATNTPMGLYVEDFAGTTVNLALSSGITFSGQSVAPIVRYGLGSVPGLEATGPTAAFAEALGLIARLTAPEFPIPPTNTGAAFFYTVSAAISAAVASPAPYPSYAVVYDLSLDEFFVGNGMVIQRAINAASSGGKVNVLAGTYTEQLNIDKSLTLAGAGTATTTIKAPPAASRTTYTIPESTATWDPIVFARGTGAGVINVSISGFTIDGQNNYGASGTRYVGVLYRNVKPGTISSNVVKDLGHDGTQTFGILVYGDSDVTISSNNVSNYGRGGIGANGDAGANPDPTATIQGNTVTGPGATAPQTWASNGIQIGWGATGSIVNNEVTGNGWPGTAWTGTGIIVVDSNNVIVQGNNVHDNESGIVVGGYYDAASGLQVKNNTVNNNDWGIQVINNASNTIVEDNTVTNQNGDGIDVWNYGWPWTLDPTGTEVHNNSIVGSGYDGAWTNVTAEVVDMEDNWWGDASGPLDAADDAGETTEVPPCTASPASEINADGSGDSAADDSTTAIDYCPWLNAAPLSVSIKSITAKPQVKPPVRSENPSVVQPIE